MEGKPTKQKTVAKPKTEREETMEREMKAAVQAWKVANGKAAAPEHQGWSKARREDLLVNGVYAISKANTIKGRK